MEGLLMSYFDEITTTISDGPQVDAFGRLRVSNPVTLFDNKLRYGKSSTLFSELLLGGATSVHDPNNSCVDMGVTTTGDVAVRQTRTRLKYQAGKSQLVEMTGLMEPVVGTKKAIGYFQSETTGIHGIYDGVCFESIDNTMYVSVYKSGVATRFAQGSWNRDKLDGNGPSGVTVDWSKCQIFQIDLQWLGVGRVRYYLNIDGSPIFVHEVDHANSVTNVYMRSGSQPLSYRLESTGSPSVLKQICCTVQSEGGSEQTGIVAAIDRGISVVTVNTTPVAIIGIRLKSTELDAITDVLDVSLISTTNDNLRWFLAWNPPAVAGTKTWNGIQGGSIETLIGDSTNIVTEGLNIDSGYSSSQVRATAQISLGNLGLGSTVDGVPDEIYLCCQSLSGSATVTGGITLRQLV
jgi:hypothetical protein